MLNRSDLFSGQVQGAHMQFPPKYTLSNSFQIDQIINSQSKNVVHQEVSSTPPKCTINTLYIVHATLVFWFIALYVKVTIYLQIDNFLQISI